MLDDLEDSKEYLSIKETESTIKRRQRACPACKNVIPESYIAQNLLPVILCPSCGSSVDINSIEDIEIPADNERTNERFDTSLKVTYRTFNEFIIEYTKNVSAGGMFIKTRRNHSINDIVELFLHVPELESPIKLTAKVMRINMHDDEENAGIGVKYMDIDENSRKALVNFLRNLENSK